MHCCTTQQPGASVAAHRHLHLHTKEDTLRTPGLLTPIASNEGEGGGAKYGGKRLSERRKQQAEDLEPDPVPSPEFTLPLIPFAWLFSSPAASLTC